MALLKRAIRFELKRMIYGHSFRLALFLGVALAALQFATVPLPYAIADTWKYWREGLKGAYPPSLFNTWIGMTSYSIYSTIYYYLLPLLCCLPCATRMGSDIQNGYAVQAATRSTKKDWMAASLIANLIGACLITLIPQAVNLLSTALVVPAYRPLIAALTFPLSPNMMGTELFYANPLLYTAAYAVLDVLIVSSMATLAQCLCVFGVTAKVALVVPFCLSLGSAFMLGTTQYAGYVPSSLLAPHQFGFVNAALPSAALYAGLLLAGVIGMCIRKDRLDLL